MGIIEMIKGEQPGPIKTLLNYKNPGQFGEFATEYALINDNIEGNFVVLKNLYLSWNGKTTEIDLLMVHEKGIFVFESKNYSGWIFGDSEQLNWTQCLKGGEKNKFYNPIRQNRTHIKALAAYLGKPVESFTSYIVFSERCSLKSVPANTDSIVVVRRPKMLRTLRSMLETRAIKYTAEEIQDISSHLMPLTNRSAEEKKEHIDAIRNNCPFCGSELVLRKGKYGDFWGCSTYPNCKFTRKL